MHTFNIKNWVVTRFFLSHRTLSAASFFLLLLIMGLGAYRPVLNSPLACDDYYLLGIDKLHLFGSGDLGNLSSLQWPFYAEYPVFLRPTLLSVWMLFSHFFGMTPWPYHVLNVFLHTANAWLLFLLLRKLRASTITAIIPALLFVLSPVAPEAVSWPAGNSDLFPLFFLFLGLCFYAYFLERGKKRFYIGSLVAITLGLFSKEMMLVAIFIVPLAELLFGNTILKNCSDESGRWQRNPRAFIFRVLPFFVIYIIYLSLRFAILGTIIPTGQLPSVGSDTNPIFSITTFLSPVSINFFSIWIIIIAYVFMVAILTFALFNIQNYWGRELTKNRRLLIFLIAAFVASFMPVSSYLVSGLGVDMARSHFLYMPTAFFLAFLAVAIIEIGQQGNKWKKGIAVFALAALLPFYFWGLQKNNYSWENDEAVDGYILKEIERVLPDPPAGSKIYLLIQEGSNLSRVTWCSPMLQPGVRSALNRFDIQVIQGSTNEYRPGLHETDDGYLFIYDEKNVHLTYVHTPK